MAAVFKAGDKLHARAKDGVFYLAEVVAVSEVRKRSQAPVRVHFAGQDVSYDAWVGIEDLRSKKLPDKDPVKAAPAKVAPAKPAGATAKADKAPASDSKVDVSALETGLRLQVLAEDGTWYLAEVMTVSKDKKRKAAPVKVHYAGYTDDSDEWVGVDRLRSKALRQGAEASKSTKVEDFEYAGRKVKVKKGGFVPTYEKTLFTDPKDPRIKDLFALVQRFMLLTPKSGEGLTVESWGGHWLKGCRSLDWSKFLGFLGVPKDQFEDASTYEDLHWYTVRKESFTMRHHIPSQGMDLHYTAAMDGEWRLSPYAKQTSSTWSEDEEKKKGFKWHHSWTQFPVSMRTEWENRHMKEGDAGHGQPVGSPHTEGVTSITVMERHLISRDLMNFRIWVYPLGGDPEDASKYLVPLCEVVYMRIGDELPADVPQLH